MSRFELGNMARPAPAIIGRQMLDLAGAASSASATTSAHGGVLQPAGVSVSSVAVNVGCFNVGIDQNMLTSGRSKTGKDKLRKVIETGVAQGKLNLLGLCEVGGHDQGLERAGVFPQDLVTENLTDDGYRAHSVRAYMSIWRAPDAGHHGEVSLRPLDAAFPITIPGYPTIEPQLVIWSFVVAAVGCPSKMARHRQGQLHIRTPHGRKAPSAKHRIEITTKALQELDAWADSGAIQPTVRILTGDVNLSKDVAMSICQHDAGEPDVDRHWHVQ